MVHGDNNYTMVPKETDLPSHEECVELFRTYMVPENIRKHCEMVCRVAENIAGRLYSKGCLIDKNFTLRLAMLHDLFKMVAIRRFGAGVHREQQLNHEQKEFWEAMKAKYPMMVETEVAYEVFKDKYPQLARAIKNLGQTTVNDRWEQMVVHYSDFMVIKNELVSIDERLRYLQEHYQHPEEWWEEYTGKVRAIENLVLAVLGMEREQLRSSLRNSLDICEDDETQGLQASCSR